MNCGKPYVTVLASCVHVHVVLADNAFFIADPPLPSYVELNVNAAVAVLVTVAVLASPIVVPLFTDETDNELTLLDVSVITFVLDELHAYVIALHEP